MIDRAQSSIGGRISGADDVPVTGNGSQFCDFSLLPPERGGGLNCGLSLMPVFDCAPSLRSRLPCLLVTKLKVEHGTGKPPYAEHGDRI